MSLKGKHICLVIPTLQCGGAERVMTIMANYWACEGAKITVITYDKMPPFYELGSSVIHIRTGAPLDKAKNKLVDLFHFFSRIKCTAAAIRKVRPDVVISFLTNMNVIATIAAKFYSVPIIIAERGDPGKEKITLLWQKLYKWTTQKCNGIVVQTQYAKHVYIEKYIKKDSTKINVIPNPLRIEGFSEINSWDKKIIIGMGRLIPVKGFDILIDAFHKAGISDDWNLIILGEGDERAFLEQKIQSHQLNEKVFLPGNVTEVGKYLQQASIFVLSSKQEGFPNALCEAMITGLACISCRLDGITEIIEQEKNGLLVKPNDVEELVKGIKRLANDERLRIQYGTQAKELKNKLALSAVMNNWEMVIHEVIKKNND